MLMESNNSLGSYLARPSTTLLMSSGMISRRARGVCGTIVFQTCSVRMGSAWRKKTKQHQ
jgi:hypothetical protein